MKKVLVFGATGTVGAYTCIYLKERKINKQIFSNKDY